MGVSCTLNRLPYRFGVFFFMKRAGERKKMFHPRNVSAFWMKPALRAVVRFIRATSFPSADEAAAAGGDGVAGGEGGVGRRYRRRWLRGRGRQRGPPLPEGKAAREVTAGGEGGLRQPRHSSTSVSRALEHLRLSRTRAPPLHLRRSHRRLLQGPRRRPLQLRRTRAPPLRKRGHTPSGRGC
jgi:hypothetical protein